MSQTALASATGGRVAQKTISQYEAGEIAPSLPAAVALAEALGVTVQDFLTPAEGVDSASTPKRKGRGRRPK